MSVIFGIFDTTGTSAASGIRSAMLREASFGGTREVATWDTDQCLLGATAHLTQLFFHNPKTGRTYLRGGEYFAAPGTPAPPARQDSDEAFMFLDAFFEQPDGGGAASLDGHFAVVRYDPALQRIDIVNDRMGLYPIYVVRTDAWTAFSSEYQIVAPLLPRPIRLDRQFLAELSLYGFACDGRTPIEGFQALPPATRMSVDRTGAVSAGTYATWEYAVDTETPFEEHAAQICSMMRDILCNQLSDGRVESLPITGGYDSRLLLGLLPEDVRREKLWVTNCSPHLEESEDRDVIIAKEIADRFGLRHEVLHFPAEPQTADGRQFYERLRPDSDWFNVQGHFSGYLKGMHYDFRRIDNGRAAVFAAMFSGPLNEWAADEFRPISGRDDYFADANRNLKYYLLHNIRTFMNKDPLHSGKWVNPISMFLQSLRTPFGAASLYKKLLTVPSEYIVDGSLFLAIMQATNAGYMDIPFTSSPFAASKYAREHLRLRKIEAGRDYQVVRRRTWDDLFKSYLLDYRRRTIYSTKHLRRIGLLYAAQYSPLKRCIPAMVKSHWRYKRYFKDGVAQDFIRLESWLRLYADGGNIARAV